MSKATRIFLFILAGFCMIFPFVIEELLRLKILTTTGGIEDRRPAYFILVFIGLSVSIVCILDLVQEKKSVAK